MPFSIVFSLFENSDITR